MEVVPSKRIKLTYGHHLNINGQPATDSIKQQQYDFGYLLKSGDFSDAVIHVHGVEFPVHRNILACCSEYFKALFTDKLQNSTTTATRNHEIRPNYLKCQNTTGHVNKPRICFTSSKKLSSNSTCPQQQQQPCKSNENPTTYNVMTKDSNENIYLSKTPSDLTLLDIPPEGVKTCTENWICRRQGIFRASIDYVTPSTMSLILEHAYGGQAALCNENVEQLLTAADRFQMTKLVDHCSEYLSNNTCIDNCISIYKFSSNFYGCSQLRQKSLRFILDNFEAVFQTSTEFEHLTEEEFSELLIDDNLNVRREENVLDSIYKWAIGCPKRRKGLISKLVKYVRLGSFLPENFAIRMLHSRYMYECNPANGQIILDIIDAVTMRQGQRITGAETSLVGHRLPKDLLFVIGGSNFGYPLGIVEVYDSRTLGWNSVGENIFAPRSYHGTAYVNNEIYVIGGFDGQTYLSCCCKCCPDKGGTFSTLENVTPMHSRRCYVGVVQLHDLIYAIGGFDGVYRLSSAERFDYRTNQWSFIAPMSHHRSDAGVAVLDDKIFVCGGFSGTECTQTVEMYDPVTNEWTPETSMPDAKSGLGLVSHDGCLYAVGGFNGIDSAVRLANMDCYNPATGQWTVLRPMSNPRSNLAVAVLEDLMYAIGGYDGERTSSVVECYDFKSETWFQSTRLSRSRSALSVCLISGLSNTATILGRDNFDSEYELEESDDGGLIASSTTAD